MDLFFPNKISHVALRHRQNEQLCWEGWELVPGGTPALRTQGFAGGLISAGSDVKLRKTQSSAGHSAQQKETEYLWVWTPALGPQWQAMELEELGDLWGFLF